MYNLLSRLALKIVVMTRELLTGKRLRRERQPNGFGQLYFSLLISFFPLTYLLYQKYVGIPKINRTPTSPKQRTDKSALALSLSLYLKQAICPLDKVFSCN
jgi:hypothetical protein